MLRNPKAAKLAKMIILLQLSVDVVSAETPLYHNVLRTVLRT